ncbi:MAG: hypothetical protein QF744_10795 [SAR202 cluster bacterium]|nr:hypothetical protein [SAR202 cluster bacterium]
MLGTPRLLTFGFRALVLLLLFVILWLGVAREYNLALARIAGRMLPDDAVVWELGVEIVYESPVFSDKVAIDGLTLHFGLILLAVLVLAAVGIGLLPRLAWLAGMVSGAFVVHVGVVAILGRPNRFAGEFDASRAQFVRRLLGSGSARGRRHLVLRVLAAQVARDRGGDGSTERIRGQL